MSSGLASVGSTSATAATPPALVPAPTTSRSTSKLQSGDSHAALLEQLLQTDITAESFNLKFRVYVICLWVVTELSALSDKLGCCVMEAHASAKIAYMQNYLYAMPVDTLRKRTKKRQHH